MIIPNTKEQNKYETLVKRLLQQGPSNWRKFINKLRPTLIKANATYSTDLYSKVNQKRRLTNIRRDQIH